MLYADRFRFAGITRVIITYWGPLAHSSYLFGTLSAMNARLKAEIICTGSELLGGKLNLYVPLFYERLAPLGFAITREQSCGDGLEDIASCMRGALSRADLVLVCGGLGPTFDDLTRAAAARVLGRSIYHSKECEGILRERYGARVRLPNLKDQCRLVAGAKYIRNDNGTAFGELLRKGRKLMVLLPGPRLDGSLCSGSP